jgi:hypothetical protein
MADIKNFGLVGVGSNVQLGKSGPRLKKNAETIEARTADDSSLAVVRAAPGVGNNDVVTLNQLNTSISNAVANAGPVDGFHLVMGNAATEGDGSFSPGAITITETTKVSDAIDGLNEILALLTPAAPPAFPNGNALTVANTAGTTPVLANGVVDNSGTSTLVPTNAVSRITAAGVSSNTFQDMGPGNSGTMQLLLNGSVLGSKALTGTGDGGTYSGLVLADQKDYPLSTAGFWKSIDTTVTLAAAPLGVNKFRLNHTGAGQTSEIYFVRDHLTAVPAVTANVVEGVAGTLAYSSSVPHYNSGASLNVNGSISNLAGQTYYGGTDPLVISASNSILTSQTLTYATLGISTPINANTTTATNISQQSLSVNGTNIHNMGTVTLTGRNVNGSTGTTATGVVLVKRGTAAGRIDELSVTVTGLGSSPNTNNAIRMGLAAGGDTPVQTQSAWDATAAIQTYDATVVGGTLKHDQTNYSSGYLPAGPNLSSGRTGAQYVTFSFNRSALSAFKIVVTGTYAGCWIGLPGVSDNGTISPNAANGWWNAFQLYDGAGVPGKSGDTLAGCAQGSAMSGASGTFSITFGTQSSTNATGNQILVRIRLNAGQSISALSFTN